MISGQNHYIKHITTSAYSVILCLFMVNPSSVEDESSGFVTTGTAIAIMAKGKQIAAAADSKILITRGRIESTDCKIKQVGNVFFAIAGHRREELSDFDAIYIATEACNTANNIQDRIIKFETMMKPALYNLLWVSRKKAPSYYESSLRDKMIVQVAFFGFERGSPYLYVRSYKDQSTSSQVGLQVERKECLGRCDMLAILGKSRAAEKYLIQTPSLSKKPLIDLVKSLVELEIEDEPEIVGPPIDLLQLSKNGENWIERKSECQ
jgi:hypothetical protein